MPAKLTKVARWVLSIPLLLLSLVAGVLLGLLLSLRTDVGREWVRAELVEVLGDALGTRLEIARVERIGLGHATLLGVRIFGPDGDVVASAQRISAELDLTTLLDGTLSITRATVVEPWVQLGELDGAGGGLPDAIGSSHEPEPEPESPEDEGEDLRFTFSNVRVVDGTTEWKVLGHSWSAAGVDALGNIDVPGEASVRVPKFSGTLRRDGEWVAAFDGSRFRIRSDVHGVWGVDLKLTRAAASTRVKVELQAADTEGRRRYEVSVRAKNVSGETLSAFGAAASVAPISGRLRVRGSMQEDFGSGTLTLDRTQGRYGGLRLPEVRASGDWGGDTALSLPRVVARYPGAKLEGRLVIDADGGVSLRARVRASALERVPPLRDHTDLSGAVRGRVTLSMRPDGPMRLRADLTAERLRYASVAASTLRADVDLRGHGLDDLGGRLALNARGLHVAELTVPTVRLELTGGPRQWRADGAFEGDARHRVHGAVHATLQHSAQGLQGEADARLYTQRYGTLSLRVRDADYADEQLSLGALTARVGSARLHARGLLGLGENASNATIELHVPSLASSLAPFTDLPVTGGLTARASIEGKLAAPRATVDVHYRSRRLLRSRDVRADASLTLDLTQPIARVRADARGRVRFDGDTHATHVTLRGNYDPEQMQLALSVEDGRGPLFTALVDTDLRQGALPRAPADVPDFVTARTWQAEVVLSARKVRQWPGVHLLDLPPELLIPRLDGAVRMRHVPGKPPLGDATLHVDYTALRQSLSVTGELRDGALATDTVLKSRGVDVARASTRSRAPLDQWFRPVKPIPVEVTLALDRLQLGDLPWLRQHARGTIDGTARLTRSVSRQVEVQADLRGRALRVKGSEPFDATVGASLDQRMVRVHTSLSAAAGRAEIVAKLPLDDGGRIPSVRFDAPLQASVDLKNIDVSALLAVVPQVDARSGTLTGHIQVRGSLVDPRFHGRLQLRDVTLLLPELGQPFEHVNGTVLLSGRTLELQKTRVRDREGHADLSGRLELRSWRSFRSVLRVDADDLPLRRSGVIMARLNGKLQVEADVAPERTHVSVALGRIDLELTDQSLEEVQDLEPDPRITLVDEEAKARRARAEESESPTPLTLVLDASDPFWMRRDDFSLLLSLHLTVRTHNGTPEVTGTVEIERGVVVLVGQIFDVEDGRIEFSGGHEIAPTLMLTATRRVPGGSSVTVIATGSLPEPELAFTVDGAAVTAGEALAAASGGRRVSGSAGTLQSEIGSVAGGVTAGVLTMGARRELGEWLPVLAVETAGQETRLRAGIAARRLIPVPLRKFVVDAYVEGMLVESKDEGAAAADSSAQGTGAAVLIELWFPNDFVAEAQLGPYGLWSADIGWEP